MGKRNDLGPPLLAWLLEEVQKGGADVHEDTSVPYPMLNR